jgi:hypothetical protein
MDATVPTPAPARAERWTAARGVEVALSLAALVAVLSVFARFVGWVQRRPGVVLADPVLAWLTPRDLTWVIFGALYASVVLSVVALVRQPRALAVGFRAYGIMVLLRMAAMAVTPLDPPPAMIPLQDPFVQHLGTGGELLTRDLFFSGHTATMTVLVFFVRRPVIRALLALLTVVVAVSVVWQAVHYAIDVLAAPVFAYAACRLAEVTSARAAVTRE